MAQRRWQIELMGVNLTTRGQVSEINRKAVMNKKTALKWRCFCDRSLLQAAVTINVHANSEPRRLLHCYQSRCYSAVH
ncbi:hypothetical protein FKQ62_17825 [Vibrio sp. B1-2]|nr:hypothetical protein [Vibrio sp. B1-2]